LGATASKEAPVPAPAAAANAAHAPVRPKAPPPATANTALPANVTAPSPEPPAAAPEETAIQRYKRERKEPPTGPLRPRPPGWQPPDPFAKEKAEKAKKEQDGRTAAGDRR
jgi:hypothetical protein